MRKIKQKNGKGKKKNKKNKHTLTLGTPNFYHTSMVTKDAKPITQIPEPKHKT